MPEYKFDCEYRITCCDDCGFHKLDDYEDWTCGINGKHTRFTKVGFTDCPLTELKRGEG